MVVLVNGLCFLHTYADSTRHFDDNPESTTVNSGAHVMRNPLIYADFCAVRNSGERALPN